MEISVVIPTFNRCHTLGRAIQSVLEQKYPAKEILVVDDGSTDSTASFVKGSFSQVKLIRQQNLGVSAARNTGITESRTPWIALLDSDDQWKPDKLLKQVMLLDSNPDYRICHTDEVWIRNGKRVNAMKKHRKPSGWIFNNCLPLCCVSPSSVMLHRSVIENIGNFDETLPVCEDYDLWLRVFQQYPAALANQPLLVKFGGHPDQLSRKYWGMDRFRVQALIKILESSNLDPWQTESARAILVDKLRVLVNGFLKRGNIIGAEPYEQLLEMWATEN